MKIQSWLKQAVKRIQSEHSQLDATFLLAARLRKTRAYLLAYGDTELSKAMIDDLEKDLQRLEKGYPLAYILGQKSFWDMELQVTEATLIPRADTETLIEVAMTLFCKNTTANIIDLGTGSGAIAIALSRIFPQAKIIATDICYDALAVAKDNARKWQVAPIEFIRRSWLDGFSDCQFDMIISNPPYIAEGDIHLDKLCHEPIKALTAEKDGLSDITTIIKQSQKKIKKQGWLLLEHGYSQGKAVQSLLNNKHWKNIKTHHDLSGNERITVAQQR